MSIAISSSMKPNRPIAQRTHEADDVRAAQPIESQVKPMSHACIASETNHDVRCPVCGGGFLILTTPGHPFHSGGLRRAARRALAAQHDAFPKEAATNRGIHPDGAFDLPAFDGAMEHESSAWDVPAWVRAFTH